MGHLTFISEEVVKFFDRNPTLAEEKYKGMNFITQSFIPLMFVDLLSREDWQDYVSKTLRYTIERDRKPLGGVRPSRLVTGTGGMGMGEVISTPSRGYLEGDAGANVMEVEDDDDGMDGTTEGTGDQVYIFLLNYFVFI